MPTPKIQLLRDMRLAADDLSNSITDCEWRTARTAHETLLGYIKQLEEIYAHEPLPFKPRCQCINCEHPNGH